MGALFDMASGLISGRRPRAGLTAAQPQYPTLASLTPALPELSAPQPVVQATGEGEGEGLTRGLRRVLRPAAPQGTASTGLRG